MGTYKGLAQDLFKSATYVIDKYHYVRQILWAFEAVSKEVQKDFSDQRRKYFKKSKTLLIKHFKDLTFYYFMASKDYQTAKEKLQNWIVFAQNSGLPRFVSTAKTMLNWQKGILNSFTTPYTNGYTEGMNNKIKVLKRNAYGYRNFNRFRNRILHMCNTKSS